MSANGADIVVSMLNRFKDQGGTHELPLETQDVMISWADYAAQYQKYARVTHLILNELVWMWHEGKLGSDGLEPAVELQLTDVAPDLVAATTELQRSLQSVQGWQVNWRNLVRGEVIGVKEDRSSTPGVVFAELVRAPYEFEEDTAWIANSQVGFMPAFNQFGAWLAINYEPGETNGIYMPIDSMFEIELHPPEAAVKLS